MKANVLCVLMTMSLLAMLLPGTGLAGIEPSPFQPQINQLHSIELNVGALDKRMAKLAESNADVYGKADQLQAIANKLADLDARVEITLDQLPPLTAYFDGSDDVLSAMEGIKSDSDSIRNFAERMGIDPSPFLPYADALQAIQFNADTIKLRSISYICPVGAACTGP